MIKLSQFPLISIQLKTECHDFPCADWNDLPDHLRDVPQKDIFRFSASAAASEFFLGAPSELVQVRIDVYIPYFNIRSSLIYLHGFQLLVSLPYFIEISYFIFTKRINLLILKWSSDRLVIVAKGFLKLLNLNMLVKVKSPLLHRNLARRTFGKLLILFSTKVNLLYLLYSMARRCCLLHLIKQHCLLKTFLRTLILRTQYLFTCFPF